MAESKPEFDVFLSYSSVDGTSVEWLAQRLRQTGFVPFLDAWNLVPGGSWQQDLAKALEDSATAAVFIGQGEGPWRNQEMQLALDKAVRSRDDWRVIPVLLPGARDDQIPPFLKLRTWVDFRPGLDDEQVFRRLVAGIRGEAVEAGSYSLPDEPAPYRGLLRFEAAQADYFFGRETDIQRLIGKLTHQKFVAIVGASGSGKSSLVLAGLLPKLAEDALPGSRDWNVLTIRPGGNPLRSLAEAVALLAPPTERLGLVEELTVQLARSNNSLRGALVTRAMVSPRPLLLVIDQFEEVFTQHEETRDDTPRFIANLAGVLELGGNQVRVVITLRADFLDRCLQFPLLRKLLEDGQLLLGDLGDEELREAIIQPARKVGAFFEKGLVNAILREVEDQRGALPLLQHALYELWRARRGPWLTLDAYEESGGVSGALERRAQQTFDSLSPEQKLIARNILLRLTSLEDGTRETRRRAPREELYPKAAERREVDAVLERLASPEARLVVADQETVEVTHEALIEKWETLRGWLRDNRRELRLQRRLTETAVRWKEHSKDPGDLFRGATLAEAEEWLEKHAGAPTPLELEFLEASRELRDQETRRELENARRSAAEAEARVRRSRRIIALLALVLLVVVALASWGFWAERRARTAQANSYIEAARSLSASRPDHALAYLASALRLEPESMPAQSLLTELLLERSWPRLISEFREDGIRTISLSRDGRQFATLSEDETISVRDTLTFRPIGSTIRPTGRFHHFWISEDGRRLVASYDGPQWRTWDIRTGRRLPDLRLEQISPDGRWRAEMPVPSNMTLLRVRGIDTERTFDIHLPFFIHSFTKDSRKLIIQSVSSLIFLNLLNGHQISVDPPHRFDRVTSSPDGHQVWVWGRGATIWDIDSGKRLTDTLFREKDLSIVRFSPDGRRILTADDSTVQLWNINDLGKPLISIAIDSRALGAGFSQNGELLLVHLQGEVFLSDSYTGTVFGRVFCDCSSVMFWGDTHQTVSVDRSGFLRRWDFTPTRVNTEFLHNERAQFSKDGSRLLIRAGHEIHILDTNSGQPSIRPIPIKNSRYVRWTPNMSLLATFGPEEIRVWDTHSARLSWATPLRPLNDLLKSLKDPPFQLSPNGRAITSLELHDPTQPAEVYLWSLETGSRAGPLKHDGHLFDIKFSPQGDRIVTLSKDGTVHFWSSTTGTPIEPSLQTGSEVASFDFSSDGLRIATSTQGGEAWIWDVRSGKRFLGPLRSPAFNSSGVRFEQKDRLLLTWGFDSTRIWDAYTGRLVSKISDLKSSVYSAQLSPDGGRLIMQLRDGSLHLLGARTGRPLRAPISAGGERFRAFLSPNGNLLWFIKDKDQVHVLPVPIFPKQSGELLARWAEAVGGYALDAESQPQLLTDQFERLEILRRETADAPPGQLTASSMIRWFLADPGKRPVSPVGGGTVEEYMHRHLEQGTQAAWDEAASAFPGHPLLRKYPRPPSSESPR